MVLKSSIWHPNGTAVVLFLVLESCAQRGVERRRGTFLLAGQQVGVDVQRDGRVGVTGSFRDDVHRHPAAQQVGDMGVSQPIESHMR